MSLKFHNCQGYWTRVARGTVPGTEWAWPPPLHWSMRSMNTKPTISESPIINCNWSVLYVPSELGRAPSFITALTLRMWGLSPGTSCCTISTDRILRGRSGSWGLWLWWLWSAMCVCVSEWVGGWVFENGRYSNKGWKRPFLNTYKMCF